MELALIGRDIAYSLSPQLHAVVDTFAEEKNNYSILDLTALNVNTLRKAWDFDGLNVTVPYKCEIIPYLSGLDESARCGAVNTVCGGIGYNTDGMGMYTVVKNKGIKAEKVLILGNGGAARAIARYFYIMGAFVTLAVRDKQKGILALKGAHTEGDVVLFSELNGTYDIIINATSVGLKVDYLLLSDRLVAECGGVFDAVYGDTLLSLQCKRLGVEYTSGLHMLVYQALLARKIWGLKDVLNFGDEIINKMERLCVR